MQQDWTKRATIVLGWDVLTHCGLVTPYDNTDLCQHWYVLWLVAWWQHISDFQAYLMTDGCGMACEITLRWLLMDLTDDKST